MRALWLIRILLSILHFIYFFGGEYKNVEICYGGSPPPPYKKQKLDSTEKRESDTIRGQQVSTYFHPILDK